MTDKICKNCTHWEYYKNGFGNCSSKLFEYDDGTLDDIVIKPETKFLYWDGSGYAADFSTHETFGCIGFEYIHDIEQVEQL